MRGIKGHGYMPQVIPIFWGKDLRPLQPPPPGLPQIIYCAYPKRGCWNCCFWLQTFFSAFFKDIIGFGCLYEEMMQGTPNHDKPRPTTMCCHLLNWMAWYQNQLPSSVVKVWLHFRIILLNYNKLTNVVTKWQTSSETCYKQLSYIATNSTSRPTVARTNTSPSVAKTNDASVSECT